MPLIIKKRRTKEELQQLEEAKRAAKKTKAAKEREAYTRLPQPPMIGRNALIMEPKGPKDYSGEKFRTMFRQRLLEGGEIVPLRIGKDRTFHWGPKGPSQEYNTRQYDKKYGTRDWNEATKMAKAHIKKYNSKTSVARLRAEFLERILEERSALDYNLGRGKTRQSYPEPPKSWENVPPPSSAQRKTKSDS